MSPSVFPSVSVYVFLSVSVYVFLSVSVYVFLSVSVYVFLSVSECVCVLSYGLSTSCPFLLLPPEMTQQPFET